MCSYRHGQIGKYFLYKVMKMRNTEAVQLNIMALKKLYILDKAA